MRRRSRADGYCRRYMTVSASYPQRRATYSTLLALLADPVRDILGELFQVFTAEDSYATLLTKIAAHLGLQFVGCFLLRAAYQGDAGLVATHLSGTHIGLKQLLLQKSSAPALFGALGSA